jgi:hypothetical protein
MNFTPSSKRRERQVALSTRADNGICRERLIATSREVTGITRRNNT